MKKHLKRVLVLGLAIIFIVLGIVGLALPFLQGFLFLAIGLLLLSLYSPRLRAYIDEKTVPYPRLHRFVIKAEAWVVRVFGAPEE